MVLTVFSGVLPTHPDEYFIIRIERFHPGTLDIAVRKWHLDLSGLRPGRLIVEAIDHDNRCLMP